jgi:hypothetical protein
VLVASVLSVFLSWCLMFVYSTCVVNRPRVPVGCGVLRVDLPAGWMRIICDTLVVNGTVSSNGRSFRTGQPYGQSAGAGGSVWITTRVLQGVFGHPGCGCFVLRTRGHFQRVCGMLYAAWSLANTLCALYCGVLPDSPVLYWTVLHVLCTPTAPAHRRHCRHCTL